MPDRKPAPRGVATQRPPRTHARAHSRGHAHLAPAEHPGAGEGVTAAQHRSGHGAMARRRRVLLLNTTFEPLTALPLRRAIVLLVCGKAELVHGDQAGLVLHSATASVEVPSVIKLSTFVHVPYRGRVPFSRAALMHRDNYRCAYCGARAETIDHVVPRSRGGAHTWENCVASCAKCNHRKADRTLRELGWTLPEPPKAPRGRHWRLVSGLHETDPLWLPYLGGSVA